MKSDEQSARVQLLYRDVNERIQAVGAELLWLDDDSEIEVLCECLRLSCATRIPIATSEYLRVRTHPGRFVVLAKHEAPSVESVVETHVAYLIVEKDVKLIERLLGDQVGLGPEVGQSDRDSATLAGET
jgi:hypothetical protein